MRRIKCVVAVAALGAAASAWADVPDAFDIQMARDNSVNAHAVVFGQAWRVTASNSTLNDHGRRSDSTFTFAGNKGDRVKLTAKSDQVGGAPLLGLGNCYSLDGYRASPSDFYPNNSQDDARTAVVSVVYVLPVSGKYACVISLPTWKSDASGKDVLIPATPYTATVEKL